MQQIPILFRAVSRRHLYLHPYLDRVDRVRHCSGDDGGNAREEAPQRVSLQL